MKSSAPGLEAGKAARPADLTRHDEESLLEMMETLLVFQSLELREDGQICYGRNSDGGPNARFVGHEMKSHEASARNAHDGHAPLVGVSFAHEVVENGGGAA